MLSPPERCLGASYGVSGTYLSIAAVIVQDDCALVICEDFVHGSFSGVTVTSGVASVTFGKSRRQTQYRRQGTRLELGLIHNLKTIMDASLIAYAIDGRVVKDTAVLQS